MHACARAQGKGVDVIVDCVGAPYLEKDLECLAMDGRVIFIGWMGGAGSIRRLSRGDKD